MHIEHATVRKDRVKELDHAIIGVGIPSFSARKNVVKIVVGLFLSKYLRNDHELTVPLLGHRRAIEPCLLRVGFDAHRR